MKTIITLVAGLVVGAVGAVLGGLWLFKDDINSLAVNEEEDDEDFSYQPESGRV